MIKFIKHHLPSDLKKLKLYSISDLHVGEKSFDVKMFQSFKNEILNDKEAYVILAGDLMNNAIKSSVSDCYEDVLSPNRQKKWLKENLKCLSHKVLAIVSGNHELRSKKTNDDDIMYDIADSLGLSHLYSPIELFVKITFGRSGNAKNPQMYSIYVNHGSGGGTAGSAINRMEKLSMNINADIYINGHYHKRIAYKHRYRHVDLTHERITERERLFVVSSHWAKYYGGYASQMMLQPSANGSVPIILHANKKYFEAKI